MRPNTGAATGKTIPQKIIKKLESVRTGGKASPANDALASGQLGMGTGENTGDCGPQTEVMERTERGRGDHDKHCLRALKMQSE